MRPRVAEAIFSLDRGSPLGLQAQIRETVVSGVLSGRLLPGSELPSTRKLAEYLNVSRITVTLAYQELVCQDYVEAIKNGGHRIGDIVSSPRDQQPNVSLSSQMIDWRAKLNPNSGITRHLLRSQDISRYPFPFIYGPTADGDLFDLAAWRECTRRSLARRDFDLMHRDPLVSDDPELVSCLRTWVLPRRGINASPDEILVTLGAQDALWLVIQLLLNRDSHVAFENPCKPHVYAALKFSQARLSPVDVDETGLVLSKLPTTINAVFVAPGHQVPTAVQMPMDRRLALMKLAEQNDFVIVERDYEVDMSFTRTPLPALKSLDIQDRVLFVGTLSRSLFPGARLGYLVAPAEVIREARRMRSLLLRHPPEHLQRAVAYFVTLGYYEAGIKRMRNKYRALHDTALSALDAHRLTIRGDGTRAGTAFWIDGQEGLDTNRLARDLETAGVLIEPGAQFFADHPRACQYFRMAYTSVQPDRIAEGIGRIAMAMKKLTCGASNPIKPSWRASPPSAPQRPQLANMPSYSSIT